MIENRVVFIFLTILAIIAFVGGFCIAWWVKPPVTYVIETEKTVGYTCEHCGNLPLLWREQGKQVTVYRNGKEVK